MEFTEIKTSWLLEKQAKQKFIEVSEKFYKKLNALRPNLEIKWYADSDRYVLKTPEISIWHCPATDETFFYGSDSERYHLPNLEYILTDTFINALYKFFYSSFDDTYIDLLKVYEPKFKEAKIIMVPDGSKTIKFYLGVVKTLANRKIKGLATITTDTIVSKFKLLNAEINAETSSKSETYAQMMFDLANVKVEYFNVSVEEKETMVEAFSSIAEFVKYFE